MGSGMPTTTIDDAHDGRGRRPTTTTTATTTGTAGTTQRRAERPAPRQRLRTTRRTTPRRRPPPRRADGARASGVGRRRRRQRRRLTGRELPLERPATRRRRPTGRTPHGAGTTGRTTKAAPTPESYWKSSAGGAPGAPPPAPHPPPTAPSPTQPRPAPLGHDTTPHRPAGACPHRHRDDFKPQRRCHGSRAPHTTTPHTSPDHPVHLSTSDTPTDGLPSRRVVRRTRPTGVTDSSGVRSPSSWAPGSPPTRRHASTPTRRDERRCRQPPEATANDADDERLDEG